jgi:hypothetical protein
MPTVSEALYKFLNARKTPANADLIARWGINMETQVNVAVGDGEPVPGKRATFSNGTDTWHAIRVPKDANSEPTWEDYELRYPFDLHAEGIGCTGFDWQNRCSRWVAFDFDALTGHAKGVGVSDEALQAVKQAAMQLPYVEVRKSTGGNGLHLYVYLDGIPTENHTVHAALARCIMGMMSAECGFDFATQIDACGGVMWVWHRKMTAENGGLSIIKPASKILTAADLPANWRDHIEVVTRKRSKVRVNEVAEDKLDTFEALASSQTIVPLDAKHKAIIEALQRSNYTTIWVADHHLLQTHTCALKALMDGPEAADLKLIGAFDTNSEGRNPGNPNCFMFAMADGAFHVYRFSPGVVEAATWNQDGKTWTSCYYNRYADLATAAKLFGGLEDSDHAGHFTFSTPDAAAKAATTLGLDKIDIDSAFEGRKTTLRVLKDGRLAFEVERKKGDDERPEPKGWLGKKTKWVAVCNVVVNEKTDKDADEAGCNNLIRPIRTSANQFVGWMLRDTGVWIAHPGQNIKLHLQSLGHPKDQAEAIMGAALGHSWELVNLPFREEYPGGRRWNLDGAQFSCLPAELGPDEKPYHPHWDKICDHIGEELTPFLEELAWAQEANIKTGAEYVRAWIANAFRNPFLPSPYLFLWGNENSGKSILHEALSLLVTKGVVKADKALTSAEFNGELAGAIITAVEEKNLSKFKHALARIKEWVTALELSIRRMRMDCYQTPNTTHWIQTANRKSACPIFPGDSRITMIFVGDLPEGAEIGKAKLLDLLKGEAPHFLRTLLDLRLPPVTGRLSLPVITTGGKESLMADNSSVQEFVDGECKVEVSLRDGLARVHREYVGWAVKNEYEPLDRAEFKDELFVYTRNRVRDEARQITIDGKKVRALEGIKWVGGAA